MPSQLTCPRCGSAIPSRAEATLLMHHELADFTVRHITLCTPCGAAFLDFLKPPAPSPEAEGPMPAEAVADAPTDA